MPERPDLRQIAASLRESLDGLEREALIDILTYVLNEYVVEGPAPLSAGQVERLEDLQGLGLAALVGALQARLDVPGLELFRVEGEEVRVQTTGGWVALSPGRGPARAEEPLVPAAPPAAPPAAAPPRAEGRAGAQFEERGFVSRPAPQRPAAPEATGRAAADEAASRGRGDLYGGERGVVNAPPPRPRGVSVTGRPAPAGGPPAQQPPAPAPQATPPAPPPQQQGAEPPAAGGERKDDDASIRFSLLELD